jgi:hypothetical protein
MWFRPADNSVRRRWPVQPKRKRKRMSSTYCWAYIRYIRHVDTRVDATNSRTSLNRLCRPHVWPLLTFDLARFIFFDFRCCDPRLSAFPTAWPEALNRFQSALTESTSPPLASFFAISVRTFLVAQPKERRKKAAIGRFSKWTVKAYTVLHVGASAMGLLFLHPRPSVPPSDCTKHCWHVVLKVVNWLWLWLGASQPAGPACTT